ncbi:tetratricopeptide repeat protein [Desulfatiglans anilini]|uniref:tetratricopeptide repeat protein n=1 Tax=Desulfatiglans anilini TaxID=90728 RepID=UPI00041F0E08|nr:tetratricopeptide repeat protein [Desulfatiglans anilini]
MRRSTACALIFALLLPAGFSTAADTIQQSPDERFYAANQAYREARFAEAARGYEALIHEGWRTGDIYFNLGNAYLKMDKPGRAILHYERARDLIPRDPDLVHNLEFARDRLVDPPSEPKGSLQAVFFWLGAFSLGEVFWGFAVINALFWGIVLLRFWVSREWLYYLFMAFGVLWLVVGLSLALKWHAAATDRRAVVLVPEAGVLAGPAEGDTVLFPLREGAILEMERCEGGWALVHLSDKKRGWIPLEQIEAIRP